LEIFLKPMADFNDAPRSVNEELSRRTAAEIAMMLLSLADKTRRR
jgi:hypothetical protein